MYHVTKMKHIVNRLQKLVLRQDTFLVEVKEQIYTVAAKSPNIRIHLNNNIEAMSEEPGCSGRSLSVKIVSGLNPALVKLTGSKYERETGRIVCGKCQVKVKPRPEGGSVSILKYFKTHHYDICGNKSYEKIIQG